MEKTNKKTVIISTVGTSLFENFERGQGEKNAQFKTCYKRLKAGENSDTDIKEVKSVFTDNYFEKEGSQASAEISSIEKFMETEELEPQDVNLYFITTDTTLSYLAAGIILDAKIIKDRKYNQIKIEKVSNLDAQDAESFENSGLPNLAEKIRTIKNNEKGAKFFINITGGYKAVLPFMYLIARMYEMPAFYLYQETLNMNKKTSDEKRKDIIFLPEFKLAFNPFFLEKYSYYLKNEDKIGDLDEAGRKELLKLRMIKPVSEKKRKDLEKQRMNHEVSTEIINDDFDEDETELLKGHGVNVNSIKEKKVLHADSKRGENERYFVTGVGKIVCDWVEEQSPESSKIFGKFIEHKLFETYVDKYFNRTKTKNGEIKKISHGDKYFLRTLDEPEICEDQDPKEFMDALRKSDEDSRKDKTGKEIDLLIEYQDGTLDLIEIKSLVTFVFDKEGKVQNQFKAKIEFVANKIRKQQLENTIVTFILYDGMEQSEAEKSEINGNTIASRKADCKKIVEEVAKDVEEKISLNFKYVQIDRSSSQQAFNNILDYKIKLNQIKDI